MSKKQTNPIGAEIFLTSKKKKKHPVFYIIIALVIITAGVMSYFIEYNDSTPSWNEIYNALGVNQTESDTPLSVHFIDVGQGDCILIKSESNAILIDAGEKGNENTVIEYIRSQGIQTLDYVIATHPHSDHIGSLDEVIDAFTVSNVIMPKLTKSNMPTTSAYESLLTSIKNSGAKVISAKTGASYTLDKLEMTVLSPIEQSDDLNDMSVVINLTYGDTSFLFMGDAEKSAESLILKSDYSEYLNVDVLKVGHHGSSTSTGKKFLSAVSPETAVIMCGIDNEYGHPHDETIALLSERNINVLRTDELGTIVIGSDGFKLVY